MKRNRDSFLFRACYSKGVRHHHCLGQRLKGRQGVGKFYSGKNKGFRYALTGGC